MIARDINPFIRIALINTRRPYNKLVKCADCRIFYVLSGHGHITVNGNEIPFSKDMLFMWKSGTEYRWNFSKNEKASLAIIDFDYTQNFRHIDKVLPLVRENDFEKSNICETETFEDISILNTPIFLSNVPFYKKTIIDIIEEVSANKLYSQELAENMLKGFILNIVRYASSSSKHMQAKIEPILEYINQNYNKEITNAELGKMINYHPHYINTLMKEYTGTTLHSYLTECRMNKAVNLIINTDLSIESIALETGFKNPTHFCKIFKQKFGTNPSSYRKSRKLI